VIQSRFPLCAAALCAMLLAPPQARADDSKPPSFTLPTEKTADIAAHFRQRREYLR